MKLINNLFSLSGRMGSGKDTVFKIIQGLSIGDDALDYYGYQSRLEFTRAWVSDRKGMMPSRYNKMFENKKFSEKLKLFICSITGKSMSDIEDPVIKELPLGPDWEVYYLSHYKLSTNTSNGRISPIFSSYNEALRFEADFKLTNGVISDEGISIVKEELTLRRLMQLVGTEGSRELITPKIWINGLFADYNDKSNWIITDNRFINEAEEVTKRGGLTIRINREMRTSSEWQSIYSKVDILDPDGWNRSDFEKSWNELISRDEFINRVCKSTCRYKSNLPFEFHVSETELDNYKFDIVIDNSGDLNQLIDQVYLKLFKDVSN